MTVLKRPGEERRAERNRNKDKEDYNMKTITLRTLALTLTLVTILGLTSAFAATNAVTIDKTNFPDATFRTYVKQFDENGNGELEAAELRQVDWIDVNGKKAIKSLKGIEYFTALEALECSNTSIKSLDVSKNTKLVSLDCSNTSIKSLDVRKNSKLEILDCYNTPLTSIKLGTKKNLDELALSGTKLTSIDISGCRNQLEAVTDRTWSYTVSKGVISWDGKDSPLTVNTTTKVKKGSKVLFTYAKPKTFKFSKSSVTVKRKSDVNLWGLLKRTPSNSVYATTFTCNKKGIIDLDKTGYAVALKKGTVTVTAKSGGKKATIKVTVK